MSPVRQQRKNSLLSIILPALAVFLFEVFTGAFEFVHVLYQVHLLLVLGALGLVAVLVTGRLNQVVLSPVGRVLTLFTVWFVICIPFAVWRGGSFGLFVSQWSKTYLAYILTAGLISTLAQCRKIFHTIAYSVGFAASLALLLHKYDVEGRLSLPGTRYGNANEFGFALLVGLPFLAFMFVRGDGPRKTAAVILTFPVVVALSKTGSRACLLGAGMLFLFAFLQASGAARAKLAIAVPILFLVLVAMAPSSLRARYSTLFKSDQQQSTATEVSAADSAEARWALLKDSLWLTLMHPIFGVGPGDFMIAQNDVASDRGEAGSWHVTHNTYTQLSSEMGIPGLLIYCAFLFQCWKVLTAIIRRRGISGELRMMAKTVRVALVVLLTVAFFDSLAYDINIPILAGLVTALSFIARAQRSRTNANSSYESAPPTLLEPEFEPAWSTPSY